MVFSKFINGCLLNTSYKRWRSTILERESLYCYGIEKYIGLIKLQGIPRK